jgi:hypothetical protein
VEDGELAPRADKVNWEALSERSRATLRVCWSYVLIGWSTDEIAATHGLSRVVLKDALEQLRVELLDSCR